jgi:hypothetical protein
LLHWLKNVWELLCTLRCAEGLPAPSLHEPTCALQGELFWYCIKPVLHVDMLHSVLFRRVDAATANRVNLTREEVELIDVAAEMEQQLMQQYTQVCGPCMPLRTLWLG